MLWVQVLPLSLNASIAQGTEQHSSKVIVPGSNPGGGVIPILFDQGGVLNSLTNFY